MLRSVSVNIGANPSGFIAGTTRASTAIKQLGVDTQRSMGKAMTAIDNSAQHLDRIGTSLTRVGVTGAAGLALVGKAAMDWESAWAGVTKTVDGSSAEMANLEGELRGLAKTLPSTHQEIAAVAEAAGQLGVKRQDITAFTRTMIDLGETTNLSADEAATSIAQLMNVMGTAPQNVGRLGATLVALGNAGASTERDIIQMAQRIAGAGKQVGLTEGQVLAFSNALASVGIDAEAGGTAISTSFLKIDQAVRTGGEGLELLARTAGMSAAQFKTAFQRDAAGATNAFIIGLGKVQREGGNTTKILKDLGIVGIRESDALRRLASSGGLLTDSLKLQGEAWRSNSALVEEAAKRYATTEAQARIAWNQIKDSAISAGQSMLPVLAQIATMIGNVAEWFGDLPEPVRIAGVALAATTAIMALGGAAALKGVTGLAALRTAYQGAGLAATTAGRAMKIAQLAIPGVGIALFAATTAMQLFAGKTTTGEVAANTLADAMQSVEGAVTRSTAALNENVRAAAIQALQQNGAFEMAKRLGLSLGTVTDAALGNRDAIAEVNAVLRTNLDLNPQLSKGNAENRQTAIDLSRALGGVANESIAATAAENDRRGAMEGGAAATNRSADAQKRMGAATDELRGKHKALNDEIQKSIDKFTILREGALDQESANIGWERALDNVRKAVKANGKSLDVHSEKGRTNRETIAAAARAMNDKAAADFKAEVKSVGFAKATERASDRLKTNRANLREAAKAAGFNKDEIDAMIRKMLKTPKKLETDIKTKNMKKVLGEIDDLKEEIRELKNKLLAIQVKYSSSGSIKVSAGRASRRRAPGERNIPNATGGVLPGYTPGRDVHEFTSPTAGVRLSLSGGEGILIPQATKALGGEAGIKQINDDARTGRLGAGAHGPTRAFQSGGVFRTITVAGSNNPSPNVGRRYDQAVDAAADRAVALARAEAQRLAKAEVARQKRAIAAAARRAAESGGASAGRIDVNNPRGLTTYRGGRFTNLFAANLRRAEKIAGQSISVYQGGWRPATSYSGTSHAGDAVDAQPSGAIIRALRRVGIASGDRTGLGNWMPHSHSVPTRGAGYAGGSAVWQAQDYLRRGGASQGLRSPWGLSGGGVMTRRGLVDVAETGPERVLSPVQTKSFDQLVRVLDRGSRDLNQPRRIVERSYAQGRYGAPSVAAPTVVEKHIHLHGSWESDPKQIAGQVVTILRRDEALRSTL
jgi:TP901 family phage tail tape measure protein